LAEGHRCTGRLCLSLQPLLLLTYSNEAVLPFYLLHQTIILTVGWFVLPWDINNVLKFFIIALVSFPTILVLYELFVRHMGFMCFLFGMAPQKKQTNLKKDTTWKSKQQSLTPEKHRWPCRRARACLLP